MKDLSGAWVLKRALAEGMGPTILPGEGGGCEFASKCFGLRREKQPQLSGVPFFWGAPTSNMGTTHKHDTELSAESGFEFSTEPSQNKSDAGDQIIVKAVGGPFTHCLRHGNLSKVACEVINNFRGHLHKSNSESAPPLSQVSVPKRPLQPLSACRFRSPPETKTTRLCPGTFAKDRYFDVMKASDTTYEAHRPRLYSLILRSSL